MLLRVLRRTGVFAASLVVASIVVFAFMRVLPGDPARVALGMNATEQAVAELRAEYGLDQPLVMQYLDWAGSLLTGDLGTSYTSEVEIGPMLADRLAVTGWLVGAGILVAVMVAIPMGTLMATRHRHPDGTLLSALSQLGIAVPAFITGMLGIALFAVVLGWLPSNGWVVPNEDPIQFLRHLVMPAIALGLAQAAVLSRYVRSAVLDVMREPYMRTARAKGLTTHRALVRHGLQNAAIPVATVLGLQLSTLLVGAIIVEQIFVIHGLGSMLLDGVEQRDLILVQNVVMVLVLAVLLVNYLVELFYVLVDPRLRTEGG